MLLKSSAFAVFITLSSCYQVAYNTVPVTRTSIDAGYAHVVAINNRGKVVVWGENKYGQCDIPDHLDDVVSIAAGELHTLALKSDGTVVAWGCNRGGACDVPGGLNDVVAISAGGELSMALRKNGTIVVWGRPDMPDAILSRDWSHWDYSKNKYVRSFPGSGVDSVVAISCGSESVHAITCDGILQSWASRRYGYAGISFDIERPHEQKVRAVSANMDHVLVANEDGSVTKWGYWDNEVGSAPPKDLKHVVSVKCRRGDRCMALTESGSVIEWGIQGRAKPNLVVTDAVEIALGSNFAVAVRRSGRVVVWGPASKYYRTNGEFRVWLGHPQNR